MEGKITNKKVKALLLDPEGNTQYNPNMFKSPTVKKFKYNKNKVQMIRMSRRKNRS